MHAKAVARLRHRPSALTLSDVAVSIAVIVALVLMFAPRSVKAAGAAFVRVNQVGYAAGATKRAYLMASGAETGATFSVKDARGSIVYSAAVGAKLGSWSSKYPDVYALDFDSLTRPGTYTISVSGPIASVSPGFPIGPAVQVYGGALSNALYFYQNERDGADFIRSALRTAPGHLNDEHAMTYLTPKFDSNDNIIGDLTPLGTRIDASGGWWDAGDYLKFVETTSYTVDMMELGVRDFTDQLGVRLNRREFHIRGEVRPGLAPAYVG